MALNPSSVDTYSHDLSPGSYIQDHSVTILILTIVDPLTVTWQSLGLGCVIGGSDTGLPRPRLAGSRGLWRAGRNRLGGPSVPQGRPRRRRWGGLPRSALRLGGLRCRTS